MLICDFVDQLIDVAGLEARPAYDPWKKLLALLLPPSCKSSSLPVAAIQAEMRKVASLVVAKEKSIARHDFY